MKVKDKEEYIENLKLLQNNRNRFCSDKRLNELNLQIESKIKELEKDINCENEKEHKR